MPCVGRDRDPDFKQSYVTLNGPEVGKQSEEELSLVQKLKVGTGRVIQTAQCSAGRVLKAGRSWEFKVLLTESNRWCELSVGMNCYGDDNEHLFMKYARTGTAGPTQVNAEYNLIKHSAQ